ncbi:MAG: sigma-70 family RNA polymerase sigma factor [Deltaproteobacteria bacterium]|nr:sigma-70 family RNA polymerase sigma factor [Deltaproteobacteria bacterium]
MTEQEKSLIAGCLRGDKAAWDTFVQQYSNLFYHTIRKTLTTHHVERQDDLIEELFQDIFVALSADGYRKLKQFRGDNGCTLASWLRTVAARLTIDSLRKPKERLVEIPDNLPADRPNIDDTLAQRQQEQRLSEAIQELSDRDKLLVDLHYRKGLDPREIAAILHTSEAAVYTQKSRLIGRLRDILEKNRSL